MAKANNQTQVISRRKLALVIGVEDYKYCKKLQHAKNDANSMESTLQSIGFIVTKKINSTHDEIETVLLKFKQSVQKGDMILFYFAGHGIQCEDQNFLIPKEQDENDDNNFRRSMLSLNKSTIQTKDNNAINYENLKRYMIHVQSFMEDFSNRLPFVTICLLDCCRVYYFRNPNIEKMITRNPFANTDKINDFKRVSNVGSVFGFACAAGAEAYDNQKEGNGLFTKHLLNHITKPNIDILMVLRAVTVAVTEESKSQQIPYCTFSLSTNDIHIEEIPAESKINNIVTETETLKRVKPQIPNVSKNDRYQYLSHPPTDPTRMKPINGAPEKAMAASSNFLVVFTDNNISTFHRSLSEKKYNKWNDGLIIDISFCSPNIGFILLTESKIFKFSARNHNHIHLANIQPYEDNIFSHCTSNGQSLLISYKIPGTPIDEIHTSTWKLKKRWKSSDICKCDEYINCLRYSSDLSVIGITLYSKPRMRFELHDSNMNTLRSVSIGEIGCCGFTAIPQSSWLLSDGHFLYIIDENCTLTKIERQNTHGTYNDAGNVAVFADGIVVIRSQRALYFY
ncbi:unnamed protein product [Rotaria sordida]|uniref:Caspase family p20 domain-containing protein n=1 Tax=Rotaria sordida TaxID=392033 RepID=A0A815A681_9BILA|nr:unnamed protein product [Rotaria sordida]CAF1533929.1 unnamed protein product [Rotaria sordida]